MQATEPSNRPLTQSERDRDERARKKKEKDLQDVRDKEKFQGFTAPKGSESEAPVFTPPKMEPGEPVGTYAKRVREAREAFNKEQGQKKAMYLGKAEQKLVKDKE